MGGWGNRSTSAIIVAEVLMAIEYGKVAPVLPEMMEDLGFGMGFGGSLMLAFGAASLVIALPSAALASRWGHRPLVLGSLGLAVAGNVLGMFALGCAGDAALAPLIVSRILEGIGYGVVTVCGPVVISSWFPPRRRGFRMGAWGASVALGMLVATFATQMLAGIWDWRSVWTFSLVAAALALVLTALFLKMPAKEKPAEKAEAANRGIAEGVTLSALLLAFMYFSLNFGFDSFNDFSIAYLVDHLAFPSEQANFVFMVGCATMILGSVLGGIGIARAQHRERFFCLVMAAALACFFLQFRLEGAFAVQAVYQGVSAFVYGSLPAMFCFLAPEAARTPGGADVSVGIMVLGQNAGTLAGPFLCGLIVDEQGWAACSNAVFAMFVLGTSAAIAFALLQRRYSARSARRVG